MIWKDFLFGVAATLSAELLLAVIIVAAALLRSERASNKLAKTADAASTTALFFS